MTMLVAVTGRLGKDPKQIDTKSGNLMTVCSLATTLNREDHDKTTWIELIAFGKMAEYLHLHRKGEPVNVYGQFRVRSWTDKEGINRESMAVVADSILSSRAISTPHDRMNKERDAQEERSEEPRTTDNSPGGRPNYRQETEEDVPF